MPPAIDDGIVVHAHHETVIEKHEATIVRSAIVIHHGRIERTNGNRDLDRPHRKRSATKLSTSVSNPFSVFSIVSCMLDAVHSNAVVCLSLASELQGKTEDEIEMMKTMGFATFDTTKVTVAFCISPITCSRRL